MFPRESWRVRDFHEPTRVSGSSPALTPFRHVLANRDRSGEVSMRALSLDLTSEGCRCRRVNKATATRRNEHGLSRHRHARRCRVSIDRIAIESLKLTAHRHTLVDCRIAGFDSAKLELPIAQPAAALSPSNRRMRISSAPRAEVLRSSRRHRKACRGTSVFGTRTTDSEVGPRRPVDPTALEIVDRIPEVDT